MQNKMAASLVIIVILVEVILSLLVVRTNKIIDIISQEISIKQLISSGIDIFYESSINSNVEKGFIKKYSQATVREVESVQTIYPSFYEGYKSHLEGEALVFNVQYNNYFLGGVVQIQSYCGYQCMNDVSIIIINILGYPFQLIKLVNEQA